jgi:hypothetical protein
MIRITIEMLPHGDESRKRHMGTMEIANDATGTGTAGNYRVRLSNPRSSLISARSSAGRSPAGAGRALRPSGWASQSSNWRSFGWC